MRLRTPEPHNNHKIDLCSEKTIAPLYKALKQKVERVILLQALGVHKLFVNCFSVANVIECYCFVFFVYCVDDSVVSDSYAPFA